MPDSNYERRPFVDIKNTELFTWILDDVYISANLASFRTRL